MPSTPFPKAIRSIESRSPRLDALPAGLTQNTAHQPRLNFAAKYRPSRLPKTQPTADSNLAPLAKERPWVLAALLGILLLSVGLRLLPVLFLPSLNWDDEIFQATEPAHRLVFGYGIVAWEFQLGMRSWILPGTIAGLMELSRLIGD